MSGARGSARKGKRKLVCTVQRVDRAGVRDFRSHLFVRVDRELAPNEVTDRLRAKYDFPITLVKAVWATSKFRTSRA